MGGQACVFYGAAEFSRDLDLLILADPANLEALRHALRDLDAESIAVSPFDPEFLEKGHTLHFRCRREDVAGLRIDVMSRYRGGQDFEELWQRRTTLEIEAEEVDLLSLPDLVVAKKTQMDKDWPMLSRLIERAYFDLPLSPSELQIEFLLMELRSPELLRELTSRYPEFAARLGSRRLAIFVASSGDLAAISKAIGAEESVEREKDRDYWRPLKTEMERLRHARGRSNER